MEEKLVKNSDKEQLMKAENVKDEDSNLLDLIDYKKLNYKAIYISIALLFGFSFISDLAVQYFLKDVLKIEPSTMSFMNNLVLLPMSLKPFIGFLTDYCPIFGYRRKSYLIISGIIGWLAWLYLYFYYDSLTFFSTYMSLFIVSSFVAFCSILGEALVVEISLMETDNEHDKAKNYVSYFFLCKYIGCLLSSMIKGYLIEFFSIRFVFLVASFVPLTVCFCGWMLKEDEFCPNHDHNSYVEMNQEGFMKKFTSFICQRSIIIPTIFILFLMSVPSYTDPMFYFVTNELKFTPKHLGLFSVFSYIGIIFGIASYRLYLKNFEFKSMMYFSNLLYFAISFFSLILVERLNLLIGIPDFIFISVGFSLLSLVGELAIMPLLSLACIVCPKNLEATVYAYFVSLVNFGLILSSTFGASLTLLLDIKAYDFTNLPNLIIISNFLCLLPIGMLLAMDQTYFNPQKEDITPTKSSSKSLEKVKV